MVNINGEAFSSRFAGLCALKMYLWSIDDLPSMDITIIVTSNKLVIKFQTVVAKMPLSTFLNLIKLIKYLIRSSSYVQNRLPSTFSNYPAIGRVNE